MEIKGFYLTQLWYHCSQPHQNCVFKLRKLVIMTKDQLCIMIQGTNKCNVIKALAPMSLMFKAECMAIICNVLITNVHDPDMIYIIEWFKPNITGSSMLLYTSMALINITEIWSPTTKLISLWPWPLGGQGSVRWWPAFSPRSWWMWRAWWT